MNNINVAGNLTRDPELRYTPGGQAVAKFGIAVNRSYTNRAGEKVDQVDFMNVQAWGRLGENVAESLRKGSHVVVAGRLQSRSWEAEDGSKHSTVEIHAEEVAASLRWATVATTPTTGQAAKALDAEIAADGQGYEAPDQGSYQAPNEPPYQAPYQPDTVATPVQAPGAEEVAGFASASFPSGAGVMASSPGAGFQAPRPMPTMVPQMAPAVGVER